MSRYQRDPTTGNGVLIAGYGGTFFSDSPIGSIIPFGGDTAPKGWFICDGSVKSRTAYSELFAAIGTSYGAGDGSTTFNLPDLRGRVLVGLNSSETEFNALGKTGGEKTHTLVENEIPSHYHEYSICKIGAAGNGSGNEYHPLFSEAGTDTYNTQNTGGGQSHNNLQPFTVTNYIIKAFSTALPADLDKKVTLTMSHIGMIIQSTTLDTLEKVQNVYGTDTTWIQHEGYILRGASSNVTAGDNSNSGTGFGGSDTVTLTGAQSGLKGHGHGFTQPTVNGGATNTGGMSANNPHGHSFKWPIGASGGRYGLYDTGNSGSSGTPTVNDTNIAHTHSQIAHTHSVSGGAVSDAAASNATSSHSVVQRYKNVYIWERTA